VGGLALIGLTLWFAFQSQNAPATAGTPQIQVDREAVDLGDVPLGQTVEVAFEVTNTGTAPLRFREDPYIKEGC
jgi:uncharacterized protein (DUF58 family)